MTTTTPTIAPSIAVTGPKTDLVAVDAYGTTPSTGLSRLSKVVNESVSGVGDALKKSNLKVSDVAQIVTIKDGQVGIDPRTAGARADQVAGQNISGIFGTNPNLKQKALSNILGITENPRAQHITDQAGNIVRIWDGADTSRASGLTTAVNALFKDTPLGVYRDDDGILGTALAYLEEAVALGIPDAIDAIMNKMDQDKLAKQQLIDSTLMILARGDLVTLMKIMDWVGPEGIFIKVPNAIQILLGAYQFPFRSTPDQYPQYRVQFLEVLTRLKADWAYTTVEGEVMFDFSVFTRLSAHARILLLLNDDATYLVPALAARNYPVIDLYQNLRQKYPKMATWS